MKINLRHITEDNTHICEKCKYGIVYYTINNKRITTCAYRATANEFVRETVVKCSKFIDERKMPLYVMEEIAWRIEKKKEGFGFSPPARKA